MTHQFPPRLSEVAGRIQGRMLSVKHEVVELQLRLRKKRYPTPGDVANLAAEVARLAEEVSYIGSVLEKYDLALKHRGIETDELQYPTA